MSYIHEALQKAQKEKDARFPKYKKILLGPKGKQGIFFKRTVWLVSLVQKIGRLKEAQRLYKKSPYA